MASIFSKIVAGEIPAFKVAENEEFLAFLDIEPLAEGHTLVIPKTEVDYLFDVEDDLLGRMMIFSKQVAKKIEKAIPCKRIGVTVIGLEVPHAHIHLIPINKINDMNFSHKPTPPSKEQLQATLAKITG
ncbi:HIT family protein [Solitalea canadensis]|uniref:HIT family hydrolase, diadenosine tetraphosphate hydrolase n=1 Tax=Solitalea canadensis (strain ATCC 29591 / DSM 3403 / JCM 21819 / LMG 8368 / NBRC 15130 / NCIMB 12057 / USAM 9D) TaxID=929556 RepID=H8KWR1_SOLCM|nr:HIT family protein [Solitalea canadensis]AFD08240.1 HIT family hydrolase, diadenosine tetraphosphate hydrolase [Solitalea canadensis DSM 3403]